MGLSSNSLNGLSVYRELVAGKVDRDALFIPLPREAWAPIPGGCSCTHCRNEDGTPGEAYWDTLLIAPRDPREGFTFTTTVHMPEAHPDSDLGKGGFPGWLVRA